MGRRTASAVAVPASEPSEAAARPGAVAAAVPPGRLSLAEDMPHARRNHALGVAAGALGGLARAFLHPELIIAGLIYALTRSPLLVALVTIISKAGVLTPQLWASIHLEHRPKKMPYFVVVACVRAVCYAAMLATLWMLTREVTGLALALFFGAYLLVCACGGTAHVLYVDMVGRMIPLGRLGAYFGTRTFVGNILAILAGMAVIQPILAALALPWNYLLLAAIGAALATADMTVFARCREHDGPCPQRRTTFTESIRRGFGWLKTDHNYRIFFWLRILFRVNYLGLAFFIPYGTERLAYEGPGGIAVLGGILVATMQLSRVVSSVLWGKVADRRGFRTCLMGAGAGFFLAPALALLAPCLPRAYALAIPGMHRAVDLPLTVYLLALLAVGAALQAGMIGGNHFIVSSAPPSRRQSYMGFLNTITSPLTLLPLAGALLARAGGMTSVFFFVTFGGLAFLLAAARMKPAGAARGAADRPPDASAAAFGPEVEGQGK